MESKKEKSNKFYKRLLISLISFGVLFLILNWWIDLKIERENEIVFSELAKKEVEEAPKCNFQWLHVEVIDFCEDSLNMELSNYEIYQVSSIVYMMQDFKSGENTYLELIHLANFATKIRGEFDTFRGYEILMAFEKVLSKYPLDSRVNIYLSPLRERIKILNGYFFKIV